MKQVEAQIMGQSYLLACPQGGEARLLAAVSKVDDAMCGIRDAGKVKARDRIAVLAALNLAFDQKEESTGGSNGAGGKANDPSDNDSRLAQLIKRLDQVLAGDGQLL